MVETTIENYAINASNSSGADADLIEACAEYCAAEEALRAFFEGGATPIKNDDDRAAAQKPFLDRQAVLMEVIADCRATTIEGVKARARAAVAWRGGVDEYCGNDGEDKEILDYLLRDLLAEPEPITA